MTHYSWIYEKEETPIERYYSEKKDDEIASLRARDRVYSKAVLAAKALLAKVDAESLANLEKALADVDAHHAKKNGGEG